MKQDSIKNYSSRMKFSSLAPVLFVACLQLWNVDAARINKDTGGYTIVPDSIDLLGEVCESSNSGIVYTELLVDVETKSIRLEGTAEPSTPQKTHQGELGEFKVICDKVVGDNIDLPHMVAYKRGRDPLFVIWKPEQFDPSDPQIASNLRQAINQVCSNAEFITAAQFLKDVGCQQRV